MNSRRAHSTARNLMLAAISVDRSDDRVAASLAGVDADWFVALARRHRVAALVHSRLASIQDASASNLAALLRPDRLACSARHLQARQTIVELRAALTMPFLIVKGAAVAVRWYADPGLRTYTDVDVVVRHHEFGAAVDALLEAGFEHACANWTQLHAAGMAEVPLRFKACNVDLHWHLISRAQPRRDIHIDQTMLFTRAHQITLGSIEVATLDHEDTLLHLCIHTGLDGGRLLQQLVDIDRVARSGRIDWHEFTARARHTGALGLCAAVLLRARDLLGTPLPATALTDLSPFRGWLPINRAINLHRRSGRRLMSGVASGLLLASGRATPAATVGSLVHNVREAALSSVRRGPGVARGGAESSSLPNAEDARSRQHYRTWVTGEVVSRSDAHMT